MALVISLRRRMATVIAAAFLAGVASLWSTAVLNAAQRSASADRSTNRLSRANGSCEELALQQSAAYLDRLKAKDYAAASVIARKTADVCLDAGDLRRARDWFQTAGALHGVKTTRDAEWRRRYQQRLAAATPKEDDLAAAEKRVAATRVADGGTDQLKGAPPLAAQPSSANSPLSQDSVTSHLNWTRVVTITGATGVGLFLLGAAVLRARRKRATVIRETD